MRKILAIFLLLFVAIIASADENDPAAAKDEETLVGMLAERLSISKNAANSLYQRTLKPVSESAEGWHLTYVDNTSLSEETLNASSQRFMVVSLINENRFVTLTFIRFVDQGKVFYHVAESLPRSRKLAKRNLQGLKDDGKHGVLIDTGKYASLVETGYVSYVHIISNDDIGGMQYIDAGVIELD